MGSRRSAAGPATEPGADETRLRAAEHAENFPVAMRVLPQRVRTHLRAVYDVVRALDDIGDGDDGSAGDAADRTERLQDFAVDLKAVWAGDGPGPSSPVLRRLVPTARECTLAPEPFERLVAANLQDQHVTRYATWDELLGYCALSAEPIGHLVLAVFGDGAPGSAVLRGSDRVCTALQLLEHWQDVAEDRARGRIYLPAEDLAAFGVAESDLDAAHAGPALRALLEHETARAVALLDDGADVVRRLRGWARPAVAGYVAGGRAAADALRRAGWDVLPGSPPARRRDVARHLLSCLADSTRSAA